MSETDQLRADAEAMADDLADLRHRLHRHPEIGLDLPWTQRELLRELDGLPLEITLGSGLSSITAATSRPRQHSRFETEPEPRGALS